MHELEENLSEANRRVEQISRERSDLLDSLDRLERILNDFELVLQEKNDKIRYMQGR